MDSNRFVKNNKGFSLVELIAIIAIMAIMIGMGSLSLSLLIGSEAKQAAEKIGAQLNEAKTGSMSRYSEDLNVVYVPKSMTNREGGYDWADKEGFYCVKQMTTLGATPSGMPDEVSIGAEHRYICNNRVSMVLTTQSGAMVTNYNIDSATPGFGFTFDRSTGLYNGVRTGISLTTGSGGGMVTGGTLTNDQPQTLEITSGMRTYTIRFYSETGKHTIER